MIRFENQKGLYGFMLVLFCAITTLLVLLTILMYFLGDFSTMAPLHLLNFLIIAFLTTLPTLIFLISVTRSRFWHYFQLVAHFLLTAGILYSLLIYFDYIHIRNAVIITLTYIVFYAIVLTVQESRSKKLAHKLNERIAALHHEKDSNSSADKQ